jgi:hypothetical protein
VDPSVLFPGASLPAGHPFILPSFPFLSFYWSATTAASNTALAWGVSFDDGGNVTGADKARQNFFVWCVRGGQGVDPQ